MFSYDPLTGKLTWRRRDECPDLWNWRFVGTEAGTVHSPETRHLKVGIHGTTVFVHLVIWKMITGAEPTGEIDHRDTDGGNNRWENLREATGQQNCFNRNRWRKKTLPKGVCFHKATQKYIAQIGIDGRSRYLGIYDDPEVAALAYRRAALARNSTFVRFE